MPSWMKRTIPKGGRKGEIESKLQQCGLHTVCAEARCPNRAECFSKGTATFLILGDVCTRGCLFCSVHHGTPQPPWAEEPQALVDAVREMGLSHVVITSVTRDDLADGGAAHFVAVTRALHEQLPGVSVELLIPDFGGDEQALMSVLEQRPAVLNHNIETVPRLYGSVRIGADYKRSLQLLQKSAKYGMLVKSGLMVGLGEEPAELEQTMRDIRDSGCSLLTIGQYLQPTDKQLAVAQFVEPVQFEAYASAGRAMGFAEVVSGPFVRSSYKADELLKLVHNK